MVLTPLLLISPFLRHTGRKAAEEEKKVRGARCYCPTMGRFISGDTLVPDPTDPGDYTRYAYVKNNPIKYMDPSGHMEIIEDSYDDAGGHTVTVRYDNGDTMTSYEAPTGDYQTKYVSSSGGAWGQTYGEDGSAYSWSYDDASGQFDWRGEDNSDWTIGNADLNNGEWIDYDYENRKLAVEGAFFRPGDTTAKYVSFDLGAVTINPNDLIKDNGQLADFNDFFLRVESNVNESIIGGVKGNETITLEINGVAIQKANFRGLEWREDYSSRSEWGTTEYPAQSGNFYIKKRPPSTTMDFELYVYGLAETGLFLHQGSGD